LPLVLIGLAHQVMVPDVALPGADDDPLAGKAVLELELVPVPPLLLLLPPLLLQLVRASAPTAPTSAASCQLLMERFAGDLREVAPTILPPT
jgi:hypothetical protein